MAISQMPQAPAFPAIRKRKGIFGTDTTPQAMPASGTPQGIVSADAQAPEKKGMNWRNILGVIGDSLSIAGGGQANYVPMMARQRQMQQKQAMDVEADNRTRLAEWADWQRKEQWKRDNPTPTAPHYWETNDGSLGKIGPDGQPQIVYQDPTAKIQWMQVDNGDGTKSVIPYGPNGPLGTQQPQAAPRSRPSAPVGALKPYGGPSASQTGGFRR